MVSGRVILEKAEAEISACVERLNREGKLDSIAAKAPAFRYKVIYFIFGYFALAAGVHLLIMDIAYSGQVRIH
jgi:hypothetical protein